MTLSNELGLAVLDVVVVIDVDVVGSLLSLLSVSMVVMIVFELPSPKEIIMDFFA